MRGSYCYMPILPARYGAFRAVASLSPIGRSCIAPMFDVPNVVLKANQTIDNYLEKRAREIRFCWEPDRVSYLDVHNLPLDWYTTSGSLPLLFLVDYLRVRRSRVIPVTSSVLDRGPAYLHAVRGISQPEGICIRLARDELLEPKLLSSSLRETLDILKLDPSQIDVVLDFRYVGNDNSEFLRAAALEALRVVAGFGVFRNLSIAASSVPDLLPKKDQGKVRRERRKDFELWAAILELRQDGHLMPFCDYGVVGAHYVQPGKPVTTPARIRYTTQDEHLFLRGARNEHSQICKQLLGLSEFQGARYSVGDQRLYESANGRIGPGTAALWVGYDTNHHLEFVSRQVWNVLSSRDLARLFLLSESSPQPWLQPELFAL
jgi:hypothetical protein